ncbi:hypothetical protein ACQKFL_11725 [Vreelandella titanicae]|uniref:hypothetical protein n=1 Tax=Vreelandella titanicae TaxID=664683 RepID=UPI003CFBCC35
MINPSMKVVDYLRMHGRMPVIRITPVTRSREDKPASFQDSMNAKRQSEYAQRLQGAKPAHLQLWRAP